MKPTEKRSPSGIRICLHSRVNAKPVASCTTAFALHTPHAVRVASNNSTLASVRACTD